MSQTFVTGFLFSKDLSRVVLIRKRRPEFQVGKLNGVGGKIEPGEEADVAMEREFREETGVTIDASGWYPFAIMEGVHGGRIEFFYSVDIFDQIDKVRTTTDEEVLVVDMKTSWYLPFMPNVPWLVEMAKSVSGLRDGYSDGVKVKQFRVTEAVSTKNV